MEGLLLYNGKGRPEDCYKVFLRLEDCYSYIDGTFRVWNTRVPLTTDAKKHFKVGGPKCLIKW